MSTFSRIDPKSFLIGILTALVLLLSMGAAYDVFSPGEIDRLKRLASYVTPEGDLNIGSHKVVMQGSSLYDDGSQGGGLILRGGANRIHLFGDTHFKEGWTFARGTMTMPSNLDMGNRKIVMLGSSIYDDGSEGGGLILRGGANRIHFHGGAQVYDGLDFKQPVFNVNADINLGNHRLVMQGSSIFDDGSEGGGLILRGGANRLHLHGLSRIYDGIWFGQNTVDINANLNMGTHSLIMQGSSILDDGSQGGGLILRGGANNIHFFGKTQQH